MTIHGTPTSADRLLCPACGQQAPVTTTSCARCGMAFAPQGVVEAEALAIAIHTHPISRKMGRLIVVIIGGTLAIWAFLVFARWYYGAPERAIDKYFDALSNRDFNAAVAHITASQQSALMTQAVLRDPGYTPLMDVQIESVDHQEEYKATAGVSFRQGNTRRAVSIHLVRSGASVFGLYYPWKINGVDPLKLELHGTSDVTVAGVHLHRTADGLSVPALMGQYTVHVPNSPLFEDLRIAVYPDGEKSWMVEPLIKEIAQGEIRGQIKAYIAGCARRTEATPKGCPFFSMELSGENGRWTVDKEPTILFQYDEAGQLHATTSEAEKGLATFSYEEFYYGPVSHPVEFSVSGPVSVAGGRIIWQPNS
jgi:hypothetical protein